MKSTVLAVVTVLVATLGAGGAMWSALAWHLDPVHAELGFLHEQAVATRAAVASVQADVAVLRRDVDSVVGYLRGRGGLPAGAFGAALPGGASQAGGVSGSESSTPGRPDIEKGCER